MRIFKSTWDIYYSEEGFREIFEEILDVNRTAIRLAAQHWYENSRKGRFESLDIEDRLFPFLREKAGKESGANADFPVNVHTGGKDDADISLFDAVNSETGNMYLIGEGGIGKTTALMKIMQNAYAGGDYPDKLPTPVFVELSFAPDTKYGDIYNDGESTFIRRSVYNQIRTEKEFRRKKIAGSHTSNNIYELSSEIAVEPINEIFMSKEEGDENKSSSPDYLLLLDGLNEVTRSEINKPEKGIHNVSVYSMIVNEIKSLLEDFSNVRVILTSRSDESTIKDEKVHKYYLSGIDRESIAEYLKKWSFPEDKIGETLSNNELSEVLRIPLFLTVYSKTGLSREVTTRGEILKAYFASQSEEKGDYTLRNRLRQEEENLLANPENSIPGRVNFRMACFILDFILPEVAWNMERDNAFHINKIKLKKIIQSVLINSDDLSVCGDYGQEVFAAYKSSNAEQHTKAVAESIMNLAKDTTSVGDKIINFCHNSLGILQQTDGKYGFIHQHIRDYFAAVKNINAMTLASFMSEAGEKDLAFKCMEQCFAEEPVGADVRRFMGEYLGEHKNKPHYDNGKWNYGEPKENCERNLLRRALEIYRGHFNGETGYGIYSLIQILKETRCDLSGFDFSNLDLTQNNLNGHRLSRPGLPAIFKDAKMTGDTLFPMGHTGAIISATFSPDGSMVVTASDDKTAKLWDSETGECLHTFEGHTKWVNSAVFSPDGSVIVTASSDNTAKMWNVRTGECVQTFEGHTRWVNSATFSPDGNMIVTASWDGTAKLWDANTGMCIRTLIGHTGWVNSAAFSPDGSKVVTASDDRTVKLWNVKTGECVRTFEGHTDDLNSAAFSPDGSKVVTASDDRTVKLWNAETGECKHSLEGHTDDVYSAVFSPDGSMIVTASDDGTVKLWNINTGECIHTFVEYFSVNSAAFSPDGSRIVTGLCDYTAKLWDVKASTCIHTFEGNNTVVRFTEFSPKLDGKKVLTVSFDKTVKLWDVETGECKHTIEGHTNYVNFAAFSPDGSQIATASWDGTVKLWEIKREITKTNLEGLKRMLDSGDFAEPGSEDISAVCIDTLYNVCGFNLFGCDLTSLHKDSRFTELEITKLQQYGAEID